MYSQPVDVRSVLTLDANTEDYDTPSFYSDEQILDAIKRADSRIDLHLRSRYNVPVVSPDDLLRDFSSVLAAYYLTLTQSNNHDVEVNEPIRLRATEIMQELKDILNGVILLPYPQETQSLGDAVVINKYDGDLFLLSEFLTPTIYNTPTRCGHCSYSGVRCDNCV